MVGMRIKNLRKNKQGSALDIVFIVAIVAIFSCLVLVALAVYTGWDDAIQSNADIPTEAKTASTQIKGVYTGVLDWGLLLLVGILSIASIGLAAMVRVHSVFILLFVIVWLILMVIGGIAANVYDEMASTSQLATAASELGTITFIVTRLPWFVLLIGGVVMIVMYKSRGDA